MKRGEFMEEGRKKIAEQSLHRDHNNAERKVAAAKRKEIFLAAYEEYGTIRASCRAAGVSQAAYLNWHARDDEFVKELELKKRSFAESLEELALDRVRNPDKNRGSDLLLIGLLNANMPSKYRPQFAMSEDSAKELITEWRKAARDIGRVSRPTKDENGAELPTSVERTLAEILDKRTHAPEKREEQEDG
jgi:hypothetical protein